MEVKDKIEETKEQRGMEETTLRTKTTETDNETMKQQSVCNHFVISLY